MDPSPASTASTVMALENKYGSRWGVWRSDTGRWWASRRGSLSAADQAAGCVPYLRAETPDELAQRIREQEALRPLGTDADHSES